jgi:hypothetical protein
VELSHLCAMDISTEEEQRGARDCTGVREQ